MEPTLFKDSEVVTKQRPDKLSENQKAEIYNRLAQEIIDGGWSKHDISDIIEDLKGLSKNDSGYEKAKELENGFNSKARYGIDTSFIEWLDFFDDEFSDVVRENVKTWVKAHDIKPKFEIGTQLTISRYISIAPELKVGNNIYVNNIRESEAQYGVSPEKDSNLNYIINYETIESGCEVINQEHE